MKPFNTLPPCNGIKLAINTSTCSEENPRLKSSLWVKTRILNLGLVYPELNNFTLTKWVTVSQPEGVLDTSPSKSFISMSCHFLVVEKYLEICNIKPFSLIKATAITHELLFKWFVKRNAGPSLLSHSPGCETPGPNLPDLKLSATKQISKALMSVSGTGDEWSVNLLGKDAVTSLTSCITFSFSTGTSSNVFTLRGLFLLLLLKAEKLGGQHKTQADAAPVVAQLHPHTAQFPGPRLFFHLLCLITNTMINLSDSFTSHIKRGHQTVKCFFLPHPCICFSHPVSTALQRFTPLFKFSSTGQVLGLDSPSGHKVMFSGI